jgi:cytochrome c-type biogenesis protein CcmH/NrfF
MRTAGRSSRGALLSRILAALVCSAFATAGLGAAAAQAAGAAPGAQPTHIKPRTTLPIIERQVMCVTCKIPLMVAESPQANLEREYIQGLIAKGEDEAQIKRTLVVQYGPAVLGLPADHGFNLAA